MFFDTSTTENPRSIRKMKMKIAIIDLGTNSIRFDIYTLDQKLHIERTYRKKSMVRMGEDVFKTGSLSQSAIERTTATILEFNEVLKKQSINHVVAFSTCALREAKNSNEFIKKINEKTGIQLKIISGKEEARLISRGVLSNEKNIPSQGIYGLLDIGGGSTEFSICHKRTVLSQNSLALGSSRLTQLFNVKPPLSSKYRREMKDYIRSHFQETFPKAVTRSTPTLICSSGTAKAIFKIANALDFPTAPLSIGNLSKIISDIKNMSSDKLLAFPGMEPKRVDIIVSGGILLRQLAFLTNAEFLYLTENNLRDGIIDEELESLLKKNMANE